MTFTPVQIIGTQRSGSNLLRLMLNQLPEVSAPHPPHILERLMPLLPAYGNLDITPNFEKLIDDVCLLVETNPVPWTGVTLDREVIRKRCNTPTLPEIARVVYELKAGADQAHIWTCKSMANIHYAGELEKYGTPPRYIHLFRDGRDVALSFKKAIVGEKHSYHLAQQWKKEQDASIALFEELGPGRVIRVRYEDLLQNPENELKRICAFIGAAYSDAALAYHQSAESRETAGSGLMWQNVVKPVLKDNHRKFLTEMSESDIRIFERIAGGTLTDLGYELVSEPDNQPFSAEEIAEFSQINRGLKKEFRSRLRPEDLEKRRLQEELLQAITARMPVEKNLPCIEPMEIDINLLKEIARDAGKAILDIYNDPARSGEVENKADDSPLTLADKASHEVITRALAAYFPQIPVLSEEGRDIPFEERKNWHTYWCVDPLDGTREFVKRNGEFTVNIALIRDRKPVTGVIYVPVSGVTYYADQARGAWKIEAAGQEMRLQTSRDAGSWTAVGSRSHSSPEEADMLARYPVTRQVSVGSSIKFCFVAEGLAQIYFRQGPTMEWDTAAGQAILECSGGTMTTAEGDPFLYNKESLLNGSFLCLCQ